MRVKRPVHVWSQSEIDNFKPLTAEDVTNANNIVMPIIFQHATFDKTDLKEKLGDAFESNLDDPSKESDYFSAYGVPDVLVPWKGKDYSLFAFITAVRDNLIAQNEINKQLGKAVDESYFLGGEIGLPNGAILKNARLIATTSGVITFAGRATFPTVARYNKVGMVTLKKKQVESPVTAALAGHVEKPASNVAL